MSYGYSLGDVIALASLIERIVTEVKAYKSAPEHFQRLALELRFLSQVCEQVFRLTPNSPTDVAQLERIRAISLQCLGPLRTFEEKMRKYVGVLGPDSGRAETGATTSLRYNMDKFRKKLHWSMIERREVDELRAILASELLAINTLLNVQQWEESKVSCRAQRDHCQALEGLKKLTQESIEDIRQALTGSATMSAHIEELVLASNDNANKQLSLLQGLRDDNKKGNSATRRIFKTTQRHVATLGRVAKQAQTQVIQLSSMQRHLRILVENVIEYCKEILALVERNTNALMSLHAMFEKLELMLGRHCLNLPILKFENPFGITMALPYQLCQTWDGLHRVVLVMFFDKPGLAHVMNRQYTIMSARNNRVISPEKWNVSVAPGDEFCMSIILRRLGKMQRCPSCRKILPKSNSNITWALCGSCNQWSSSERLSFLQQDEISRSSARISLPPPDPIELHSTRWNGTWEPNLTQKRDSGPISRVRGQRKPRISIPQRAVAEEDETLFRRVHVQPYEGDPLDGIVRVSKKIREIYAQYMQRPDLEPSYDNLSRQLDIVVEEFEDALKDGIDPSHLLLSDQALASRHGEFLALWFDRTKRLIRSVPVTIANHSMKTRCRMIAKALEKGASSFQEQDRIYSTAHNRSYVGGFPPSHLASNENSGYFRPNKRVWPVGYPSYHETAVSTVNTRIG